MTRPPWPFLCAFTLVLLGAAFGVRGDYGAAASNTPLVLAIEGDRFSVDGALTNPGTAHEGLLMNSRMVQAIFDDENRSTAANWRYPDTGVWDPNRNVTEFIAALPAYADAGLGAVTIGLQGGLPVGGGRFAGTHDWHVSAFNADGSLKPAWLQRLSLVLDHTAKSRIAVILSLFYRGQDQRLESESAVVRAVDGVTDWLLGQGHKHVLVEIANESDHPGFDHAVLRPARIDELIRRVRARSNGELKASTSFRGGVLPPLDVIAASDFVLLHGNGQDADRIRELVAAVRATSVYKTRPTPIVFNEDSTRLANMDAAVEREASWGYYDQGDNNYVDGFQSPPVQWKVNTSAKRGFFSRLEAKPQAATLEYGLLQSDTPNRTDARALAGQTVSGPLYVFLGPEAGVRRVAFYLDDPQMTGSPRQVENYAPWDFAGGNVDYASGFDTSQLGDGLHTVTALVEVVDGRQVVVAGSFSVANEDQRSLSPLVFEPSVLHVAVLAGQRLTQTVDLVAADGSTPAASLKTDAAWLTASLGPSDTANKVTLTVDASELDDGDYSGSIEATADGYSPASITIRLVVTHQMGEFVLLLSDSADRANARALGGETVDGDIHVFLDSRTDVSRASFYLDDPQLSGAPLQVEYFHPWDFAGGSETYARPFDTRTVTEGRHLIAAKVEFTDGSERVAAAVFTVAQP